MYTLLFIPALSFVAIAAITIYECVAGKEW